MSRLRRLELHRFVGLRGSGVVFDTDDADQTAALVAQAGDADPVAVLPIVTFAPDSLIEAASRGYRSPEEGKRARRQKGKKQDG